MMVRNANRLPLQRLLVPAVAGLASSLIWLGRVSAQELPGQVAWTAYDVGSNGLVYQQIVLDLPPLTDSQLQRIGHLTNCMTDVDKYGCPKGSAPPERKVSSDSSSSRIS